MKVEDANRERGKMMSKAMISGLAGALTLTLVAGPAQSQEATQAPEVFRDVVACQQIVDDGERLACFDTRVAVLARAEEERDVRIASREQIRETRRGLFGLTLPNLGIFGGGDDDADDAEEEEIRELETTISAVVTEGTNIQFEVEGGGVWQKTDNSFIRQPRAGQSVTIRRAALGSYFAKIENGLGFRVKRVQ